MLYQSTRSKNTVTSSAAVLQGIAPDGGLYVYPDIAALHFDWRSCLDQDSLGMAKLIMGALLPDYKNINTLVNRAYAGKFETEDLTPLVKVGDDYVLELFRGPTSAFKDVALSMLPHLVTAARELEDTNHEIVILTATSGDTGKAALEGFHDVEGTRIIVFFPDNGVSPVQKAQMVTQTGKNVKVCAIRGNFDDCQRGVKETFTKIEEKGLLKGKNVRLSSANSINIGRLVPQVVYYFIAYSKLVREGKVECGEPVDYVVPTGNFGDILAGYYAKLLGLPVGRLVCASNANNVLTDFLNTGIYDRRRTFYKTSSPSMDILVSSNLERLLFLAAEGDTEKIKNMMEQLQRDGSYSIDTNMLDIIRHNFAADYCNDEDTLKTIGQVWNDYHYLCDTHTAVAWNVAQKYKAQAAEVHKTVVLSTASPFKFPAAVLKAIGGVTTGDEFEQMEELSRETGLPVPENLAGLKERRVLHTDVEDKENITDYVLRQL